MDFPHAPADVNDRTNQKPYIVDEDRIREQVKGNNSVDNRSVVSQLGGYRHAWLINILEPPRQLNDEHQDDHVTDDDQQDCKYSQCRQRYPTKI